MMPCADLFRGGLGVGLSLLLAACATAPRETVVAPVIPTPPGDAPAVPQPEPPCAWSQVKGVAILLVDSTESEDGNGTWQFFPGDEILFYPTPPGARPGAEYKALLRRPLSGSCEQPVLYLIAPIGPI